MDWSPFRSPPKTLRDGRYVILELLGVGGCGEVHLATDSRSGEHVAIKLFEIPAADQRGMTGRFVAEARSMARLRHPRIVSVHDGGREQGFYWFAMDYMAGGTLKDAVEAEGPLSPLRAFRATFQLLEGLAFVHDAGVVHRDIKPSNLLLDGQGNVSLADFGIARHPREWVDYRTISGVSMGSDAYAAPEAITDAKRAGPLADLYGVGATLYYLTTAIHPSRLVYRDADPDVLASVPEPVRPIVERATEDDPALRFIDSRQMAQVVAWVAEQIEPGVGRAWRKELSALERHGRDEANVGLMKRFRRALGWD